MKFIIRQAHVGKVTASITHIGGYRAMHNARLMLVGAMAGVLMRELQGKLPDAALEQELGVLPGIKPGLCNSINDTPTRNQVYSLHENDVYWVEKAKNHNTY